MTSGPRSTTRRYGAVLLSAALVFGGAACGAGDDPAVGPANGNGDQAAGDQAFCDAALAIGAPGEPDIDWETASEEEVRAAEVAFVEEQFQPHVSEIAENGPESLREDAQRLSGIIDGAIADPETDLGGEIFTGEGGEARSNIVREAADECGWEHVEVSMVDYAFEGAPDTIDAGTVAFEITNDGDELHEMIVIRKNDGVEQTFEELLEMPEDEAQALTTFVTAGFAEQGDRSWAVGELEAGEYILLCFIPVGTVGHDDGPGGAGGPPHFTQGMVHTFTVE